MACNASFALPRSVRMLAREETMSPRKPKPLWCICCSSASRLLSTAEARLSRWSISFSMSSTSFLCAAMSAAEGCGSAGALGGGIRFACSPALGCLARACEFAGGGDEFGVVAFGVLVFATGELGALEFGTLEFAVVEFGCSVLAGAAEEGAVADVFAPEGCVAGVVDAVVVVPESPPGVAGALFERR